MMIVIIVVAFRLEFPYKLMHQIEYVATGESSNIYYHTQSYQRFQKNCVNVTTIFAEVTAMAPAKMQNTAIRNTTNTGLSVFMEFVF